MNIKKRKKFDSNYLVYAIGLLLMIISVCVYYQTSNLEVFPMIYIPFVYIVLYIFGLKLVSNYTSPGLLVVNALYFIRYFLIPIGTILYLPPAYLSEYQSGTWLLLYEEFFLFIAYYLYLNNKKNTINTKLDDNNIGKQIKILNKVFGFLFFSSLIIYIIRPTVFEPYHFITNVGQNLVDEVLDRKETVQSSSIDTLLQMFVFVTYLLLPVYIFLIFYSKYRKHPSTFNFYLSLLVPLFVSLLFIVDTDRGGVVHRATTMIFLIIRLFPQKANKIVKLTYVPAGLLVVYMISSRLFNDDDVTAVQGVDTNILVISYLQAYVAHVVNFTDALTAYATYGDSANFFTPINDILGNVPILNHFADPNNSCKHFYDLTLGREDQPIPLVGNGLFYFGYYLSPILSFAVVWILLKADEYYIKEKSPLGIYIYAYIAIQLAFCHYQNVQLIFLYLTCMIAPIWIVFKLVKLYSK